MKRLVSLLALVLLLAPTASEAMVRPVFNIINGSSNNTAARWYGYDAGTGGSNTNATNNRRTPVSIAGTIANLYASTSVVPGGTGTWTFTLYKNNVATALTCTVTSASQTCSDTTHTVSVVAGDDLSWQALPANTPNGNYSVSTTLTGTVTGETSFSGSLNGSSNCIPEYYLSPNGGAGSSTQAVHAVAPTNFTLDKLYLRVEADPVGAATYGITLMKNDASTTLEAIATSGTGAATSDLTHSVSFVAGDYLDFACTGGGGGSGRTPSWGVRVVPTIDGESPLFASHSNNTVLSGSNRFVGVTGSVVNNTTVVAATGTVPVAFDLKKLYAEIAPAQAAAHDWNFFNQQNRVSGTLNAKVLSTATSANDTTHTVSYAIGDQINWLSNPAAGSTVLNYANLSAVSYVAPTPSPSTAMPGGFLSNFGLLYLNGYLKI